ncbi:MAG TPA: GNAT family N-acetyltransferase [Mycobacteriales bacterium]|nr:GNAT family N-acetyltransferase [Mycobacteriales bacterium]
MAPTPQPHYNRTVDVFPFDLATATAPEVAQVAELQAIVYAEGRPSPTPAPPEHFVVRLWEPSPTREFHHWVAREDGRVVGLATTGWLTSGENPHIVEITVEVHPACRGRGVATALLPHPIAAGRAADRSVAMTEISLDGPGTAYAKARGLEQRSTDRRSVLDLTKVDLDALGEWGRPDADAANDYSLVHWRGACPPELREEFALLCTAMNDAPRQELDWEDQIITADMVRAIDETTARRREDRWTTCARHARSGRLVAMTDIIGPLHWPEWAIQDDTVVLREHRGHGLGRWIKAANLARMAADRPTAVGIETWNAVTNAHMLAINEAMGFRAVCLWGEWQGPLDAVEASIRR